MLGHGMMGLFHRNTLPKVSQAHFGQNMRGMAFSYKSVFTASIPDPMLIAAKSSGARSQQPGEFH